MSQKQKILDHLKLGLSITDADARDWFGCHRLAARINELRIAGYSIKTVNEKHLGGTHARYWMEGEA